LKSQVQLLECLIADAGDALGFSPKRDIATLQRRIVFEGESFMTIAMPRLDDLLLEGLRDGTLPSSDGWGTHRKLPEFLWDLWSRVFAVDTAVLRTDPDVHAIRWIRQIVRLQKKIFEVCSDDRVEDSIEQFKKVDQNLPSRSDLKKSLDPYVRHVAQLLFGRVIGESMVSITDGKHGPGAVAERFGSNERWAFESISSQVESLVGSEFFRSSWWDLLDRPPLEETVPARLVAVPKTAAKPRLISIEPSYNQYVQQMLQGALKRGFQERNLICDYTSQDPNRELALLASRTGELATIDLSEASDRVSLALVEEIFGFNPSFLRFLRLSRSAFVQLPGGELVLLNKFASMGSALTFPIEAMVFTAIVIASICRAENLHRPSFVKSLGRRGSGLSVYGDDIIVPTRYYPHVVQSLEAAGLKVNSGKSFTKGFFRESCGVDAYTGVDITPAYMRRRPPESQSDATEIVSLSSLRNQLYSRFGLNRTVRFIDHLINEILPYPEAPRGLDGVVRWSDNPDSKWSRWNQTLYRLEWKIISTHDTKRSDLIDGYSALQKSLRTGLQEDKDHLAFAGRPVATKIIYRWAAGY